MSQGCALKNCPPRGVFVPLGQPRPSYFYAPFEKGGAYCFAHVGRYVGRYVGSP